MSRTPHPLFDIDDDGYRGAARFCHWNPRHFRGSTVNIKGGTGSLLCHLRPCKISSINSSSTSSCSGKSIITVAASCQVMMLLLLMLMVLVLTVLRVLLLLLLAPVLQVLFVQLMG